MLYFNTVSEELLVIIKTICGDGYFNKFRLFGGTALSLQIGHRISIDADFICDSEFDSDELILKLQQIYPNQITDIRQNKLGVYIKISGIKVDFLSWKIPFIRPILKDAEVRLMHLEEIIATKLYAILNRGEKKDYIDIATLLDTYTLNEMISYYQEKYNNSDSSILLKYLCSFSDIDFQAEPNMLIELDWENAKKKITVAVQAII